MDEICENSEKKTDFHMEAGYVANEILSKKRRTRDSNPQPQQGAPHFQ